MVIEDWESGRGKEWDPSRGAVDGKSVGQSVSSTDDYGDGRWERVCSGRGGQGFRTGLLCVALSTLEFGSCSVDQTQHELRDPPAS